MTLSSETPSVSGSDNSETSESSPLAAYRQAIRRLPARVSWSQRWQIIRESFPSVHMDWRRVFAEDFRIFATLVAKIIEVDLAVPHRPGKRPVPPADAAKQRLREFMGFDYSELPFPQALRLLTQDPVTEIARKTRCSAPRLRRVLAGKEPPDMVLMENVAAAYQRKPHFFPEYRSAMLLWYLDAFFTQYPDVTITLYQRLRKRLHGDNL